MERCFRGKIDSWRADERLQRPAPTIAQKALHISEFRSPFDSEFAPLNSGKVQLLTAIKLDSPGQWTSEKYLALETSLLAMG